jgi:hypothetical protein
VAMGLRGATRLAKDVFGRCGQVTGPSHHTSYPIAKCVNENPVRPLVPKKRGLVAGFEAGGDIAKIATSANGTKQTCRISEPRSAFRGGADVPTKTGHVAW